MNKKLFKSLGKFIVAMAVVLTAIIIAGGVRVHADNGKTVRVSTAKELKAAIKNADVGTIIFRTNAYIKVTIKANKAAKGKSLIIDAENAVITNKAVFADINICSAKQYIESVSGNDISLSDVYMSEGLIVSKKKKVKSLTIYDSYGSFYANYTIRKGAKISATEWIYSGDESPVKSKYNKDKKQLTLECNNDGCEHSYIVKFDKDGRITKITSKSNWPEYNYVESTTYDSNGNAVKYTGEENLSGNYTTEITYSGDNMVKSIYTGEYESGTFTYSYDKKGNVIHAEYSGYTSMDGETYETATIWDYEYDKNGRLTYDRWEDTIYGSFYESTYIYNSKGFLTEKYNNASGSESVYKYKYNKAGDKIEEKYSSEGFNETTSYEYDEFGELIEESFG